MQIKWFSHIFLTHDAQKLLKLRPSRGGTTFSLVPSKKKWYCSLVPQKTKSWFSVFPVPQNCLCSPVPLIFGHLFPFSSIKRPLFPCSPKPLGGPQNSTNCIIDLIDYLSLKTANTQENPFFFQRKQWMHTHLSQHNASKYQWNCILTPPPVWRQTFNLSSKVLLWQK